MPDTLSSRGPAIGLLETSSIARGIDATDAMMKRADVELLMTTIVPETLGVDGVVRASRSSLTSRRPQASVRRPRSALRSIRVTAIFRSLRCPWRWCRLPR